MIVFVWAETILSVGKKTTGKKPHFLKLISNKCELGSFKINSVSNLFFIRERPS